MSYGRNVSAALGRNVNGSLMSQTPNLTLAALLILIVTGCSSSSSDEDEPGAMVVYAATDRLSCDKSSLRIIGAGEQAPRTAGPAATFMSARWSPDGTQIAALVSGGCVEEDVLVLIERDSGESQSVPLPDVQGQTTYGDIGWSPDGSAIAVFGDALAIVGADGALRLVNGPQGGLHYDGLWSDDGRFLAILDGEKRIHVFTQAGLTLSSLDSASGGLLGAGLAGWDGTDLLVYGSNLSGLRPLTGADGNSPQWGPEEDFHAAPDDPRYASLYDLRVLRLKQEFDSRQGRVTWLREPGAGISSDGKTAWAAFVSPGDPSAVKVALRLDDGEITQIELPGAKSGGDIAPLIDVIGSPPRR